MKSYYAAIGIKSTELSDDLNEDLSQIGSWIQDQFSLTLRSGHSEGLEQLIESNVTDKEVYLPWKGFESYKGRVVILDKSVINEIIKKLEEEIPEYNSLSLTQKKILTRQVAQILGPELNQPVNFIIYYSKGSKLTNNSLAPIRIAKKLGIPVVNVWYGNWKSKLSECLYNE